MDGASLFGGDSKTERKMLRGLTKKELKQRARAVGVSTGDMDDADDADDPKAALIELVLQREAAASAALAEAADRKDAVRAELAGLTKRELKQRARAAGVSSGDMDDADDADNSKAVLVQLILQRADCASPEPEATPFASRMVSDKTDFHVLPWLLKHV